MSIAIIALRVFYLTCLGALALYACGQIYLLYTYVRHQLTHPERRTKALPLCPPGESAPRVTVQLPLYNERYVARRIIDATAALDYPRDRLHIQVLDDSTDDTTELIQARVAQLQSEGLRIDLIHRSNRTGYKAGALANGLSKTDGEFIAIFDADFIPKPDFLKRTVPYFYADECIGVVQARWGHLNGTDNLLTRSQTLAIDAHFAVEQYARSASSLLFSFNGSCGLWRRRCIEEAGGWQADTLTEDFDLSYRAQLQGWRFVFVRDVVVPGEVPPQIQAYKQQQARWALGSTQVLLKLAIPLLTSNLSMRQRIMGFLQLCQYAIQPVMLLTVMLTPLMILTHSLVNLSIAPLGVVGLGAPMLCIFGQQALYYDWIKRSFYFPLLMVFSSGLAVNNSRAVLAAVFGRAGEFHRTPKFHIDAKSGRWQRSRYAATVRADVTWELIFAIYMLLSLALSYEIEPSFVPYFLLYTLAFVIVAAWGLWDRWSMQRPTQRARSAETAEVMGQAGR